VLTGQGGADVLLGGAGRDWLLGEAGDDTLRSCCLLKSRCWRGCEASNEGWRVAA